MSHNRAPVAAIVCPMHSLTSRSEHSFQLIGLCTCILGEGRKPSGGIQEITNLWEGKLSHQCTIFIS